MPGVLALALAVGARPLPAQHTITDTIAAQVPWADHHASEGGPRLAALRLGIDPAGAEAETEPDTTRRRTRAVEISDAYAVRLKIHQIASFAEFPLFAAEIIVGQKLARDRDAGIRSSRSLRGAHGALAAGLGVLFGVNTITGGWNLIEGWKDPKGRTRRVIHTVLMLAADAGFLATAATAPDDDRFENGGGSSVSTHRTWAISAASVATVGTLMMWLWKG
jgi:hypothetical protein